MDTEFAQAADLLAFWQQAGAEKWFSKDAAFDASLRERFLPLHQRAAAGELDPWAASASGALALLLLLDQFPRNAFRDSPRMYATDAHARRIAHQALAQGLDTQVPQGLRPFMVLPLMHSEDLRDHDLSVVKAEALGGETQRFALHHRDIIRRFGRFPHRNAVLGRASTPEEVQFLAEGGFGG